MYGLALINTHFTSDGSGRDFIVCGDKERRLGKVGSGGGNRLTASAGRECKPRKRPNGPRPPSHERVKQMNQGLWQLSGQWTTQAKSSKALPTPSSPSLSRSASDPVKKACTWANSMEAWHTARLPNLIKTAARHEDWLRSTWHPAPSTSSDLADTISRRSLDVDSAARLAPSEVLTGTMTSTYRDIGASFAESENLDMRKSHGYTFGPGILRRPGSFDKREGAWVGVDIQRPCAGGRDGSFLPEKAPHIINVSRSMDRAARFLPVTMGETVDVRRSN